MKKILRYSNATMPSLHWLHFIVIYKNLSYNKSQASSEGREKSQLLDYQPRDIQLLDLLVSTIFWLTKGQNISGKNKNKQKAHKNQSPSQFYDEGKQKGQ